MTKAKALSCEKVCEGMESALRTSHLKSHFQFAYRRPKALQVLAVSPQAMESSQYFQSCQAGHHLQGTGET